MSNPNDTQDANRNEDQQRIEDLQQDGNQDQGQGTGERLGEDSGARERVGDRDGVEIIRTNDPSGIPSEAAAKPHDVERSDPHWLPGNVVTRDEGEPRQVVEVPDIGAGQRVNEDAVEQGEYGLYRKAEAGTGEPNYEGKGDRGIRDDGTTEQGRIDQAQDEENPGKKSV